MVTMETNPFRESMGQRVTCMGALHPNPKFICVRTSIQRHRTEERSTPNILNLESKCVDLNSKHSQSVRYASYVHGNG